MVHTHNIKLNFDRVYLFNKVPLTLEILPDFSWSFHIHGKSLDLTRTHLDPQPKKLQSAIALSSLLMAIDSSHYCTGNEDERFFPLQAARKGVFKDASGNFSTEIFSGN